MTRAVRQCAVAAISTGLLFVAAIPAAAAGDLTSSLTLRVGDARGVPGGQVTIQLRTYQSRPVKQGRITVGGGSAAGAFGLRGGATLPFTSCGSPVVFSAANDASIDGQAFDTLNQTFEFDFSSLNGTVNASDGPLAAFVCTLDASLSDGDTFDLEVSIAPGDSAFDDPGFDPIVLEPRAGRLRIRDTLSPGLALEETEVKPGAVAVIEISTDHAFAIESGQVEVDIDPALVAGTPSVRAVPRHGTVALGNQSWNEITGRFTFDFVSSDDTLNAVVPGALFEVLVPTVADMDLVDLSFPVSLIGGTTSLEGPDAAPLGVGLEPGTILFSLNPKVEDVFRDGFGGGTAYPWTTQVGWTE